MAGRRQFLGLAAAALAIAVASWFLFVETRKPGGGNLRPDDARLVALGKDLYAKHCASCHGANLEGAPNWREPLPNGRLPAPPHDASGHTWHHPDGLLIAITKAGPAKLVGGNHQSDMQGFEGVLSDEEIIAVLSFVKSTWPPEIRLRHDLLNRKKN